MLLLALVLLSQPIALKAARMFDARKGVIVQPGIVVTEGERITQVGGAALAGAQVIDLGDATLLPGLIDAHTHLTFEAGADWYHDDFYALSPPKNPRGPAAGVRRVSRGGAWRHADPWSPVAHRSSLPPHLRYSDYGLRLARD